MDIPRKKGYVFKVLVSLQIIISFNATALLVPGLDKNDQRSKLGPGPKRSRARQMNVLCTIRLQSTRIIRINGTLRQRDTSHTRLQLIEKLHLKM